MERTEQDSVGKVTIPAGKLWGAQTERARLNFTIGKENVPLPVIYALAQIKKAAAYTHRDLKLLSPKKTEAIEKAANEILDGKWNTEFPLSVFQSGSGTQTNMNVNEVIANRAHVLLGGKLADMTRIVHPNDDVNKSQSTNDAFPAAMHMATYQMIAKELLPALTQLEKTLIKKSKEFKNEIKVGRTHLQDAVPISFGQEFSGYASEVRMVINAIEFSLGNLRELPLGGTAVGTGLNTPKNFSSLVVEKIRKQTGEPFKPAKNTFAHISSHDALVITSGALKAAAVALTKIANDIRLGVSGPHTGFADITIPANEPGSSIMPGKINPTQAEALIMVCAQVIGNDLTVTLSGMNGQFQLNVSKPVIIANILSSITLLTSAVASFTKNCVAGIEINRETAKRNLERSLMNVTALNTRIGYDKAALAVKRAKQEGKTLRQVILEEKFLSAKEFDSLVDVRKMI
jgi:fumarate hydratase class II